MNHVYISRNDIRILLESLKNPLFNGLEKINVHGEDPDRLFLTERNLLTLQSKLDRHARGEATQCTLMKSDTLHSVYPCDVPALVTAIEADGVPSPSSSLIFAVSDDAYYNERAAGEVHPSDDPSLNSRS